MVCFRCTGAALQRRQAHLRRERTSTLQAMQIHETVSPARWCVNFADLQFLELEVRQAIKDGEMCACDFASSQEECGRDAELYGPSIYIVNDLYIKPITAAAGKMSWALMMNPKGLDADLFITHAWQEGVFEFIEKVLASWPPRARHAWCCMLANPQNLDIGAMIQSPKVSPFAIALQQSKYMLVVPNRHTSVYTRLWCGYEAYLAFEGKKIIRTARRSILRPVAVAWMLMVPAMLLGIACGCLFARPDLDMNIYLAIVAFLASLVTENFDGRCCLIANHLGVFTSVWLVIAWQPPDAWIQLQGFVLREATMVQRLLWLTATMFFAIAEIDRITFVARDIEEKELRQNFQGSLRFASCSQLRDEEHIRLEIGDKVAQVDQIIQVLIAAGMTSPALRDAALQGVNIDHAGDAAVAIPVLFLGPQLLCGLFQLGIKISWAAKSDAATVCFQAASIAARICFVILLCRRPIDERYFMMKVMTKLVSALLFPCLVALVVGASTPTVIRTVFVAFHISFVLVLFFAVLGIRGTLKLPCGRHLVQLFLSRFVWGCFSRPCSCPRPPDENSSSSSSDSE